MSVSDRSTIEIKLQRGVDVRAHFDGIALTDMAEGDRLVLKRSADTVRFVHPPGYRYFARCGRSCAGARCSTRGANSLLRALEIRDFVIVERASLELEPGFSVLTGETGAGKSILVDAIELLVGARAEAGVVREGCERAELSAEFDFEKDSSAATWVEAQRAGRRPGAGDPQAHASTAPGARAASSTGTAPRWRS